MTRTIALGSIYMLMLFAFAAGIKALAGDNCSDWLVTCPDAGTATMAPLDEAPRPRVPDEPDLH